MVRRLIRLFGPIGAAIGLSAAGVLVITGTFVIGDLFFKGEIVILDLKIAAYTGLVISPLFSFIVISLAGEIESIEHRLRVVLVQDPVTQAYNAEHFTRLARIELERSRRYQRPATLLRIDIDAFHSLRATYGSRVSDEALRIVSESCRRVLRRTDHIGRIGQSEIYVLLPETPKASGALVADRIREGVEQSMLEFRDTRVFVTVCVGVATSGPVGIDWDNLDQRTGAALKSAQNKGVNQVEVI